MLDIVKRCGLAVLLLSPLQALGWSIERSFDVEPEGQLIVTTDNGSITVDTHSEDTVHVLIEVDGYDEDEFQVDFDHEGRDVRIDADVIRRAWGKTRVEFTIMVPEVYNVDLSTAGGYISVEDLEGNVEVDTSGGSLSFADIVGDIDGKTSGGSIDVDRVDGEVDLRTSGGSIDVRNVTKDVSVDTSGGSITIEDVKGRAEAETSGGSIRLVNISDGVEASTSGGSVRARFSNQPAGDVYLSTSGGGIRVEIPEDASMTLNARAQRIRSYFMVDGVKSAKTRLRGDINDGGPELDLYAASGSIDIDEY